MLLDPDTSAVQRINALQYNPDTLTRTLQVQGADAESGDRLEALRSKGPRSKPSSSMRRSVPINSSRPIRLQTLLVDFFKFVLRREE